MNVNDYPRMLFHRQKEPVIVQSEQEEAALGAEWSRIVLPQDVQEPPAEYPPEWVPPEPEPLPEEPEDEPEKHPKRESEPEKRRKFRKQA